MTSALFRIIMDLFVLCAVPHVVPTAVFKAKCMRKTARNKSFKVTSDSASRRCQQRPTVDRVKSRRRHHYLPVAFLPYSTWQAGKPSSKRGKKWPKVCVWRVSPVRWSPLMEIRYWLPVNVCWLSLAPAARPIRRGTRIPSTCNPTLWVIDDAPALATATKRLVILAAILAGTVYLDMPVLRLKAQCALPAVQMQRPGQNYGPGATPLTHSAENPRSVSDYSECLQGHLHHPPVFAPPQDPLSCFLFISLSLVPLFPLHLSYIPL
ncbi:hypothetical protein GGI43DRAFT_231349 [Trichoderma evansii]